MQGIIYLLDQAGIALSQANAEIARLNAEKGERGEDSQPAQGG